MSSRIKRQLSSKSISKLAQSNTVTSLEALLVDLEDGFDGQDPLTDSTSANFSECFIEYENVPRKLFLKDLFYSVIQFRFWILFTIIFSSILFFVFIFSLVYYAASPECGLHLHEHGYRADSYLYAILVQFRTVLEPHPEFRTPFWNGCTVGIAGLFLQLFGGNVLFSILTSSLIFSFQSISRRGRSTKFSLVTLTQYARIRTEQNTLKVSDTVQVPEHFFEILAVDTNMSSTLKIDKCFGSVYVFDPESSADQGMICLESKISLMISLPGLLGVKIPQKFLLPPSHPAVRFEDSADKSCRVCGKPIADFNTYLKHLRASDDSQHDIEYENSLEAMDGISLTVAHAIKKITQKQLQFIVVVEGSDPITGDRIQVQKIYTAEMLRGQQDALVGVNDEHSNEATIEYAAFFQ